MNPVQSDVHVNALMTNVAISMLQSPSRFGATRIFPAVGVRKQSDKYLTIPAGEFHRDSMQKRAPGTKAKLIDYSINTDNTYYCDRWSIGHNVPDEKKANADQPINLDRNATRLLTLQGLIRREQLFCDTYFKSGVWGTDITGVSSGAVAGTSALHWTDAASTPIEDVDAAKTKMAEETGFEPNVLAIGRHVWTALKNHPDLIDRLKYGQTGPNPAQVTLQKLAALFEVEEVVVLNAVKNTAKKGQTAANSFIAGKHALLVHRTDAPDMENPSAGYTFGWNAMQGTNEQGTRIRTFYQTDEESDRHEIDMWIDQKLTVADLGYFWDGIVP